jgi:hypothetical protein
MIFRRPRSGKSYAAAFPLVLALSGLLLLGALAPGCSQLNSQLGFGSDPEPEEVELPSNPVERAAVLGLKASYRNSTQWQIQRPSIINVNPVAPTAIFLREQDPKELYCVCVEYEARYKVAWSTADGSSWERTVRNILVMKTQADNYMAMKPMNICPALCE